jgi:hypothetical protein
MQWPSLILASLLIVTRTVTAAAECDPNGPPFLDKEFVVIKSSASFKEATESAAKAAADLRVGLNLRGLSPDLRTGLTFSREECARSDYPYPCYVPRGRSDGAYASVEWSSKYDLFAKGLYVVMIASGAPGSSTTRRMLEAARRIYPQAYGQAGQGLHGMCIERRSAP